MIIRIQSMAHRCNRANGFTLIELMVSLAIIGVLMSLLGPALAKMMSSGRGLQCQASLRTVAFDFAMFATDGMHNPRGADARLGNRFRLSTFQESEYGIDEFWSHGNADSVVLDQGNQRDLMRCSEVQGAISITQHQSCTSSGAINPPQNVSYGFNSRLHRAEVEGPGGFQLPRPVFLTSAILQEPGVPLVWDVDGKKAFSNNVLPQFSAPALDSKAVYAYDRFWFPSFRHGGVMNVAFVGGHVLATRSPLDEPGWKWDYQPVR